jgi:hypothetical protein
VGPLLSQVDRLEGAPPRSPSFQHTFYQSVTGAELASPKTPRTPGESSDRTDIYLFRVREYLKETGISVRSNGDRFCITRISRHSGQNVNASFPRNREMARNVWMLSAMTNGDIEYFLTFIMLNDVPDSSAQDSP